MIVGCDRYQHGSVRKVPHSQGFAWEFRYYSTDATGIRKLRVQTFDSLKHPTKAQFRKAIEPLLVRSTKSLPTEALKLESQPDNLQRKPEDIQHWFKRV